MVAERGDEAVLELDLDVRERGVAVHDDAVVGDAGVSAAKFENEVAGVGEEEVAADVAGAGERVADGGGLCGEERALRHADEPAVFEGLARGEGAAGEVELRAEIDFGGASELKSLAGGKVELLTELTAVADREALAAQLEDALPEIELAEALVRARAQGSAVEHNSAFVADVESVADRHSCAAIERERALGPLAADVEGLANEPVGRWPGEHDRAVSAIGRADATAVTGDD